MLISKAIANSWGGGDYHTHFTASHWCTQVTVSHPQRIPWAAWNTVKQSRAHHNPKYTYDLWLLSFKVHRIWKLQVIIDAVCRMSKDLPLNYIQLVLNSMDHMGMDTVLQYDYAISLFTCLSVLHFGMKILNNFAWTVCNDCVVT